MKSYRLTRRATQDVLDIWSYIGKDSVSAADRFTERLHQKFQQLARGVVSGESFVDSQMREMRRVTYGNYVIYHRRVGRVTEIVRFVHGAKLLDNLDD
jgi:toxin ParE1/3/4